MSFYLGNLAKPQTMFFTPTLPYEILQILKSFKSKKSTGDDVFSVNLLKRLAESCSVSIGILVNMSLEQGIAPDAVKLARVIPIYTAKYRDKFKHYRPISMLSNISKILEKVVHKRLYSFLVKHSI